MRLGLLPELPVCSSAGGRACDSCWGPASSSQGGGLAQQAALDAPSVQLVVYVLLDGKVVCGGDHAFIEAEFFAGAVVAAKEMEHSVEHGRHFARSP